MFPICIFDIFELKLQYNGRLGIKNEQARFALHSPFIIFAQSYRTGNLYKDGI